MDIKRTFIIFFLSLGIFAIALAYNFNLILSSRNIRGMAALREGNAAPSTDMNVGKEKGVEESADLLSLTNIFSPRAGMNIPGKWAGMGVSAVKVTQVSSDFKLSGTIFSERKDLSRAIFFFSRTREEKAFREGDFVDENTRLVSIKRNSAVLSIKGKNVAVEVIPDEEKTKGKGARAIRPDRNTRTARTVQERAGGDIKVSKLDEFSFAVDESSVDYLTENINKVITQVRIIPYFESGEAAGFRLAAIRPGSAFSDLGFTSGDVIKQINGVPLTSPEKIYTIFQNLKDEKKIEVDIIRRGQRKTVSYEIR